MKRFLFSLAVSSVLFALTSVAATGQKPQQPPTPQQPPMSSDGQSPAQKYFSDVELINQNGEKMRFYSDVLKGRVVVIHSFFSTCQSACVPLIQNMRKLQDMLGDKVGKDVYLVSITVDPIMDTPGRLKAFATKNGAKSGWFFLSGKKENVDWALYKLGQYVENKNDHTSVIIMGNEPTGLWKKAFGLAKPEELLAIVESVLKDK
jgi:protein SCO1/2